MRVAMSLLFCSFTFYVTFVQYALLRRAQISLHLSEADLALGFALLAVCGILGSLAAGVRLDRQRPGVGCMARQAGHVSLGLALTAAAMLIVREKLALNLLFIPLGLGLGWLIVLLLALFTETTTPLDRGTAAGQTAAAVYLLSCYFGGVIGTPILIGVGGILLLLANAALGYFAPAAVVLPSATPERASVEYHLLAWWQSLGGLALVVIFDTALFVLVSRAPGENPILATHAQWLIFAVAHVLASLAAGAVYPVIGRRLLVYVAAGALVMLAILYGFHRIGFSSLQIPILMLYGAVVGCYTVVLFAVFGETAGAFRGRSIAHGIILIGWLASPMGIILGTSLLKILS